MLNSNIKGLVTLPAPLSVCPNCGDELVLVLTEHADDQVIAHRTQLVSLVGDRVQQLLQVISNTCPEEVEV